MGVQIFVHVQTNIPPNIFLEFAIAGLGRTKRSYSLPPCGGGLGWGGGGAPPLITRQITSRTFSVFLKTSPFQKRRTRNPLLSSYRVLCRSRASLSTCCPPSNSTIGFFSKETKSTMYCPSGAWRRNLTSASCRMRSRRHKYLSASVMFFRRCRAL